MVARKTRFATAKPTSGVELRRAKTEGEPMRVHSPPPTPVPASRKKANKNPAKAKASSTVKIKEEVPESNTHQSSGKRKRGATEQGTDSDVKQHVNENQKVKGTRMSAKSSRASFEDYKEAGAKMAAQAVAVRDAQVSDLEPTLEKAKRAKNNPYGLSPGQSPYPDYRHPTPEECHEVERLLSAEHGEVEAPKTIPTPSLNSSGCGEVPSVLDALVRTRLSAATNGANSSRAFRGLVEKFGIIKKGIGEGSVNWDAVRLAPQKDVFEAIQSGGLADVKSRDIQKILQMVYEENQERRRALLASEKNRKADGLKAEGDEEMQQEVARADSDVLSLDHLHLLSNEEAFDKLLRYPGIGPKTASCVLLFCLQRPSFAVDTHVFRLCKLLKWVPLNKNPTRNSTYAHCDVRVPDELKYPLHYLMIKHGKSCPKCSASLSRAGKCPLDGLVDRGASRKLKDE